MGPAGWHGPGGLMLRRYGQRDTDVATAEQVDRVPDVFVVARLERNVGVELVPADALAAPVVENLELDSAVVVLAGFRVVAADGLVGLQDIVVAERDDAVVV